jgi:methylated-DNA-[protein]-cysteine S-methyltransferase
MAIRGAHRFETAWGVATLEWSAVGVTRVRLPVAPVGGVGAAAPDEPPPAEVAAWADLLRGYFAGAVVDLGPIRLDGAGLSEFEAAVYAELRTIGYGATTSYGALAAAVGRPEAARAVGVAMARNRWPVVVPCHRVLARSGAPGGFSAPGGVRTKRRLLALEGVTLDGGAPPLPGLFDDA